MICPYDYDPDADAWMCPRCEDARVARYDADGSRKPPPKRNCPNAPGWQDALRDRVLERLKEKSKLAIIPIDDGPWLAKITVCLACDQLTPHGCLRWGRACQSFEKWIDAIAEGKCDRWG